VVATSREASRELRLDHLSHSSLALFAECSRQWQGKYLDGLATPTTPALVFGSAWDQTVERYLRDRAVYDDALADASGAPYRSAKLRSLWDAAWQMQLTERADGVVWGHELPEQLHAQGLRLASDAGTRAALDAIEVATNSADGRPQLQTRLALRVPGVPIPVIGFADLLTADGLPGDIKTSARPWTQDRAEREVQPLIYLAALLQMGHRLPRLAFRWWVFVKSQRPQVQVLEVEYRPARLFWVVDYIQAAWRAMQAGAFVPNPGSWRCNPTCPVWPDCVGRR
jgi:PD-(D/E)XK nuclease superfamily protein